MNAGDFEIWAKEARGRLIRSSMAILRDRTEAENVVQETLIAVWQAHRRGRITSLDGYAKRGVWLNSLRHRARRRKMEPLEAAEDVAVPVPVELGQLSAWELERALTALPSAQQIALRLRYYAGLSFKQIGETLSISLDTAASRCRYGLKALRIGLSTLNPRQEKDDDRRT